MIAKLDGLVHHRKEHLDMLNQVWERRLNYSNLETAKATQQQIERCRRGLNPNDPGYFFSASSTN